MFLCYYITYGVESGKAVPVVGREIDAFGKIHIFQIHNKRNEEEPDKIIIR